MPDKWQSDFMAACCGLSLALALGWNVTAGAAEWRQLAQNLCIITPADAASAATGACHDLELEAAGASESLGPLLAP